MADRSSKCRWTSAESAARRSCSTTAPRSPARPCGTRCRWAGTSTTRSTRATRSTPSFRPSPRRSRRWRTRPSRPFRATSAISPSPDAQLGTQVVRLRGARPTPGPDDGRRPRALLRAQQPAASTATPGWVPGIVWGQVVDGLDRMAEACRTCGGPGALGETLSFRRAPTAAGPPIRRAAPGSPGTAAPPRTARARPAAPGVRVPGGDELHADRQPVPVHAARARSRRAAASG